MKRFFFEEEDDDDEDAMDEAERMLPEFIPELFAIPHQQENPVVHILNCSIRICEKSFFWRFMSAQAKTKMIIKVFENLFFLVEGNESTDEVK